MSNITTLRRRRAADARTEKIPQRTSRIHLVGTMRAMGPDGENVLPRRKKTQAVLAYLCLAEGQPVLRGRLAGLIWDRSGEAQARDSLRHALTELAGTGGSWRIEARRDSIRLDATACWIDAFEPPDGPDQLLEGLHGISTAFDHWLIGERVRFENRWLKWLEDETQRLVTANEAPALRLTAARKLLNFMPTNDCAVRALMAAYAEMDDRAQAIREYERFREILDDTVGVSPSGKTQALYEQIRREAPPRALRRAAARPEIVYNGAADLAPDGQPMPGGGTVAPSVEQHASIAVLPFRNISVEPGHDLLAEGLADDLIETLSRVPGLFVTSRLSSAAFKSEGRPPQEIGAALAVCYLLSGSLRALGDRLRLVVELAEAETGKVLWVSRFDETIGNLMELQNGLAETLVRCVAPHVRAAELRRVAVKRQQDQGAYDLLLRAQEGMHNPVRAVFEACEALFDAAIARAPRYAAALAWRAYWHVMRVGQGWSNDPPRDTERADYFAKLAAECDATEPMALAVQGHVATYLHKDFPRAFACFESALQLNPNSARAWLWNANAHAYIGDGAQAVGHVEKAIALSPFDPLAHAYSGGASLAYLADCQYARATEFALRSIRDNPGYTSAYKLLTASSMLAGRAAEARNAAHQLLLLEPGFSVARHRQRFPGSETAFGDLYCAALADAGVPLL